MQKITFEQYQELKKKIDNIVWRDNQRRKQIKCIQNNQTIFNNNILRHEQIMKAKLKVINYDDGYEEAYDPSEQENGR